MPLYEYQCQKCGHRFERIQKFSDAMVKKCPDCGGKVEQMISAPAVQFKGSGWYVTDYAKKPSSGSSSKAEAEKKADSKSDSAKDSGKDSGSKESGLKDSGAKGKDSGPKKEAKATKER
jgi:putative FmdB family regulatory protein